MPPFVPFHPRMRILPLSLCFHLTRLTWDPSCPQSPFFPLRPVPTSHLRFFGARDHPSFQSFLISLGTDGKHLEGGRIGLFLRQKSQVGSFMCGCGLAHQSSSSEPWLLISITWRALKHHPCPRQVILESLGVGSRYVFLFLFIYVLKMCSLSKNICLIFLIFILKIFIWLPWVFIELSDACDPLDCSLPGFSVHRILQARILEWVAIPFSKGSS